MLLERKVQRLKLISIWWQAGGLLSLFIIHTFSQPPLAGKLKLTVFILMLLQAISFALARIYFTKKHLGLTREN